MSVVDHTSTPNTSTAPKNNWRKVNKANQNGKINALEQKSHEGKKVGSGSVDIDVTGWGDGFMQSSHVQNGAQLPSGSGCAHDPSSPLRISHVECLLWLWWIWMLCDCISNFISSSDPHLSGIQYTTWQHTHFHIMPNQSRGNWGWAAKGGGSRKMEGRWPTNGSVLKNVFSVWQKTEQTWAKCREVRILLRTGSKTSS